VQTFEQMTDEKLTSDAPEEEMGEEEDYGRVNI
jgi:hypothetical protein